jgi:hypothetical protein
MDGFASSSASPFPIIQTRPVTVGTLSFDYSSLGLVAGDQVTIDITGVLDPADPFGTALTTSLQTTNSFLDFVFDATINPLLNPTFNPGSLTVTIPADDTPPPVIPEPSTGLIFATLGITGLGGIRRRSLRRS